MPSVRDPTTLGAIPLFQGLDPETLAQLNQILHRKTFPAGTNIITAEQPGEAVYILLRGTVKIAIEKADGSEVILALLGQGDTVGEMSLVDSAGRSANVVTMEESTLLWMDRGTFHHCLKTISGLTYNLVRMLSGRLRLANEQILALSTLDVGGRVARQILAFADRYGQPDADGNVLIPLRLTQSDLAEIVGASRERVNHAVVYLKQRGDISVDANHYITVHGRDALAERCR